MSGQVAVGVERRLGRGVTQPGLDDLHVEPGGYKQGSEVVAKVVYRNQAADPEPAPEQTSDVRMPTRPGGDRCPENGQSQFIRLVTKSFERVW